MRVRYADTDADGVVYYANYLTFFEVVRVEWLRALGYPITRILEQGIILPVVEARLKYLRPARVDDLLDGPRDAHLGRTGVVRLRLRGRARGRPAAGDRLDPAGRVRARHHPRLRHAPVDARPVCQSAAHGTDLTMGDVYRFPGGELPPDFETRMPDDIEVKHCYRHHDRETGVSCSNCGRPICHECMIPAPVGFRCPECVKEQNARGSRAKVVTRGQIRSGWSAGGLGGSAGLTATKVLVGLNVAHVHRGAGRELRHRRRLHAESGQRRPHPARRADQLRLGRPQRARARTSTGG